MPVGYWRYNAKVVATMRIMKSKIELARWVSLSAVLSFGIAGCGGNASQDKISVPPSSYAPVVAPLPAVSSNPQSGASPKLSATVGADHLGYLAKFTLDDGLTQEEYKLKEQTMLVGPAKTEGKGFYLGEYDGNKIYRLGSGALHSVPADEGVAVNFLMAQ